MSDKLKISEVAREMARNPKEVLEKAREMGLKVANATSTISSEDAAKLEEFFATGINPNPPKKAPAKKKAESSAVKSSTKAGAKTDSKTDAKANSKTDSKTDAKSEESSADAKDAAKTSKKDEVKKVLDELIDERNEKLNAEANALNSLTKSGAAGAKDLPIDVKSADKRPIIKQTGFVIIKGKDELAAKPKATKPTISNELKDLLGTKTEKESKKKKSVDAKAMAREHGTKMNIFGGGFGGEFHSADSPKSYDIYEDDFEIMADMSDYVYKDEEEENREKKALTERVGFRKKSPFVSEGGIRRRGRKKPPPPREVKVAKSEIVIPEEVRVYEFADLAGRGVNEVIGCLFKLGMMATKNDFLDKDAIEILADEFKIAVRVTEVESEFEAAAQSSAEARMESRAPVVTIMGHVDHGKTSLLDYIRNSRVAHGEAGGITQHIGAYSVVKNGRLISFIDTPGHEAFSAMRARGAKITDIAIIVIAADDGVKAQTKEALKHAKDAGVAIIIAMNKIDKESANVDKLKAECAELGFTPNDWGGEYEFIPISAKTGQGVDDLLETILLQADVLDLKANVAANARAVVLEASLEKGRGPVATIIVQEGILKIGDSVVAGTAHGSIRVMSDDLGNKLTQLKPSEVAQIMGLNEVPSAGAVLHWAESASSARESAQKRALYLRQKELSKSTKISFDELSSMVAQGLLKNIRIVLKTDTQGSLEAIKSSLEPLNNNEVKINIIASGVGGITEGDVALASASENGIILGFNVRPTGVVRDLAKKAACEIKTYSVIYALIDDVKALISGMMSPVFEEENTGQAEVRETFKVAKVGTIAGCMVVDGKIERGIKARLIRSGVVIHTGQISSLKRFKDDAKEVAKGYECGIMFENFNDIESGDVIETFREVAKKVVM